MCGLGNAIALLLDQPQSSLNSTSYHRTTRFSLIRTPFETTAVLGTIENRDDADAIAAARRFWAVYWGTLPLVTDEAVSRLVDEFSELVADESKDWVRRRNLSMDIARACRASMGFDPPLPPPGSIAAREDARPGR